MCVCVCVCVCVCNIYIYHPDKGKFQSYVSFFTQQLNPKIAFSTSYNLTIIYISFVFPTLIPEKMLSNGQFLIVLFSDLFYWIV